MYVRIWSNTHRKLCISKAYLLAEYLNLSTLRNSKIALCVHTLLHTTWNLSNGSQHAAGRSYVLFQLPAYREMQMHAMGLEPCSTHSCNAHICMFTMLCLHAGLCSHLGDRPCDPSDWINHCSYNITAPVFALYKHMQTVVTWSAWFITRPPWRATGSAFCLL